MITNWFFSCKSWLNNASNTPKLTDVLRDPFFWGIALLKLLAGSLLASAYFSNFFIPFLEHFATHPFQNPYDFFWAHKDVRAFPYPAFMLYVLVALRLLMAPLGAAGWPLAAKFLIYHIPLFVADFAIFSVFICWLRPRSHRVILLFWGSPVLFYISYIHGQLDVIPISLLVVSLYLLFKEKPDYSAVLLGLGLASKTHLILTVPFFLLYIWRHQVSLNSLLRYLGITVVAFVVPNLPFIFDHGFRNMVFLNTEQEKIVLFWLALTPNSPQFYIIPAVYVLLLFYACMITVQNRDIFFMFLGFSFGVLLLFITPMPGWYFWVIPFLSYFFAKASFGQSFLFAALQLSYFVYFAFSPTSDFFQVFQFVLPDVASRPNLFEFLSTKGYNASVFTNAAFTVMQTLLVANCAWIYRGGIRGLQNNKLSSRTFLIGIAGDSGSGKSILSQNLQRLFTPSYITTLCGDDMHKWQRGHAKWQEYTHLNPKGNELHQELAYIAAIRQNATIHRRHYDHDTGLFTEAVTISPKPLMVLEGLHAFFLKPARDMIDLKIYMHPDDELLLHWKIQRDIVKRGYSKKQVIASVAARRSDAENYVKVQANAADIVFVFHPRNPIGSSLGDFGYEPELSLKIRISNHFCLDPLVGGIAELDLVGVDHCYCDEDWQTLEFTLPVPLVALAKIGEKYVPGFQDFGLYAPAWCDGWEGLLQLIVAYCIFHDSTRFPEF